MTDKKVEKDSFGERLREAFKRSSLTQVDVATNVLGVNPRAINNYINNEREPSLENIVKLSSALNVSVEWLITGKEHAPTRDEMLIKCYNFISGLQDLELVYDALKAISEGEDAALYFRNHRSKEKL